MATALKRYNGGQVLVLVVGAFAEMSEDVSRICDITAHDLARTHVSYYNDDAQRTNGMYRQRIQKAWGTRRTAAGPVSSLIALGISSSTARRTAARTAWRCRRTRTIRTATSSLTTPRGGATSLPMRAQPLLLLFRSNPPTEGGGGEKNKKKTTYATTELRPSVPSPSFLQPIPKQKALPPAEIKCTSPIPMLPERDAHSNFIRRETNA